MLRHAAHGRTPLESRHGKSIPRQHTAGQRAAASRRNGEDKKTLERLKRLLNLSSSEASLPAPPPPPPPSPPPLPPCPPPSPPPPPSEMSFSSYRCFGLPWFWSSPTHVLTRFQGTAGTPRDIETAQVHPHCIFSSIGYDVDTTLSLDGRSDGALHPSRPSRRWVYTRDQSREGTPLLFAGNASLHAFPPCFVHSHPRGALPHETYCFSPRVVHAPKPPIWPRATYERGLLLSWAGGIDNFGHMVFEQLIRVHTLLSLDAQDGYGDSPDLMDNTLIIFLWGCDLSNEHGAPSANKDNGTGTQRYWHKQRWQAIPTAYGRTDGWQSNLWRWLKLFSSHTPVCLRDLPSGIGFRRLHVGDARLDHVRRL